MDLPIHEPFQTVPSETDEMTDGATAQAKGATSQLPAWIGIILTVLLNLAWFTWFASNINTRLEKLEASQAALQVRYEREVIPRQDLTDRLDRIENALDRITNELLRSSLHAR